MLTRIEKIFSTTGKTSSLTRIPRNALSSWGIQPIEGYEEKSQNSFGKIFGFNKSIKEPFSASQQGALMRFLQFPKITKPFAQLSIQMIQKDGVQKNIVDSKNNSNGAGSMSFFSPEPKDLTQITDSTTKSSHNSKTLGHKAES